jgi:hypothetical protein
MWTMSLEKPILAEIMGLWRKERKKPYQREHDLPTEWERYTGSALITYVKHDHLILHLRRRKFATALLARYGNIAYGNYKLATENRQKLSL